MLQKALRLDRGNVRRASLKPPAVALGATVYEGVAARVHGPGDGLKYKWGTEYRDLAELQRMALELNGKPVVVLHPGNATNTVEKGTRVVGRVLEARVDSGELVVKFRVDDDLGNQAIKVGIQELSVGYWAHADASTDFYQRGTEVDHLAIVEFARCGAACSIRTDCSDHAPAVPCPCQSAIRMQESNPNPGDTRTMPDPIPNMNPAEALRSLEAQRAELEGRATTAEQTAAAEKLRADTSDGKIVELEKRIKELETTIAAGSSAVESEAIVREAARADAAERKVAEFDKRFETRCRERAALVTKAQVIVPDMRLDDLSDRDIMSTIVKHLDASADISESVAEGVIRGRFLAMTERHAKTAQSLARVAQVTGQSHNDSAPNQAPKKKAWQQPLPNARKGA